MPGLRETPETLKQLKERIKNIFRRRKQMSGQNPDDAVTDEAATDDQPAGATAPGSEGAPASTAEANPTDAAPADESHSAPGGSSNDIPFSASSLPNESAIVTDSDTEADIQVQKPKPVARLAPGQPDERQLMAPSLPFP